MRRAFAVATATAAAIAATMLPAEAALPPVETSRAVDRTVVNFYPDIYGNVIVRVKYRDWGPLGVKPIKGCVHDNHNAMSSSITATFRFGYPIGRVDMGKYRDGDPKCKKFPFWVRSKLTQTRGWDSWGTAYGLTILRWNVLTDDYRTPVKVMK